MPELPEVETTRLGIEPCLQSQRIRTVVVRDARLRWPVAADLGARLAGAWITGVRRRAKYLLIDTSGGTLIVHLGMSGSLRVVPAATPPGAHDHVDVVLGNDRCLRLRDPRRFGSVHWSAQPERHALLAGLGPEPFDAVFDGQYLRARARGRRQPVKNFLMDAHTVVGVGNIYASESLHRAGIHPCRAAARISGERYERLARSVVAVLREAISAGGTTLRDFVASDGSPGYFRARLAVYDRAGEPCGRCGTRIRRLVVGQRATYYCPTCQR